MAEILVRQGRVEVPFSRGILARSLLKLGIEATRAYDVATRINEELTAEGVSVLTSAHLARILSAAITRHVGPDFGARYERLRLLKQSDRPLVLLVGGSTGSGKSSIATEVAHRLDITRIQSTDSIRHVMRSMVSASLLPAVHRSSFEGSAETSLLRAAGLDPIVAGLLEQVEHVRVAVHAVLERALEENLSTILEGVHLVPGLFERFAREPRLHFVHVVAHVSDETSHRNRFLARGRNVSQRPSNRYLAHWNAIRTIQSYLFETARAAGVPCIENRSLDGSVHAVLGHILDGVGEPTPCLTQSAGASLP